MTTEALWQDLRYAIRSLRRSPGFTITVVLTLALGIGANTTMFGVIDRLMFRPFAYMRDPSTVHRVYWQSWNRGSQRTLWDTEYPRYLALRQSATSLSQLAAFTNRVVAVGSGDAARERTITAASASFFDFFDARPALGRFFTADEDRTPRGADVVVLGYAFWQSEFGGRDVRGQILQVGNIRATIMGVAPEGFAGVSHETTPAAYVPITTYAAHAGGSNAANYYHRFSWRWLEVMVRRKPGVSVAQATADASQVAVQTWNAQRGFEPDLAPADIARPRAVVSALNLGAGPNPSIEAKTALWVTGVSAIVLLIACANVANLLIARSLRREREIAVRLALGVSRRRLATHLLTESLLLAIAGATTGLLVAHWSGPAVQRMLSANTNVDTTAFIDWRTVTVAASLSCIVALITGVWPALLAGRGDLARSLRSGARSGTRQHSRARSTLLIAQAAMSVVLLIGAALFVASLDRVSHLPLGYDADPVLVVTRRMRDVRLDDSARVALRRTMLETARGISGVEHATWSMTLPFSATNSTTLFVPGIDSIARLGRFTYQAATADYFNTMGTRILRGRAFMANDDGRSPRVVILSDGAARALWPGADPIGKCIGIRVDSAPCWTVVGVAEDIVQDDFDARKRLQFYVPIDQFEPASGSTLLVKPQRGVVLEPELLRASIQRVMPGAAYVTVQRLPDIVARARRSWKLGATMFGAFGVLALIVAGIGLYGTVAYNVAQRMYEMGVRIALGAESRDVIRLVVGQSATFAVAGVVTGLGAAFLAARWIQPLLFRQSATDPLIYAAVAGVMLVVSLLAAAVPAMRATRADPNRALRAE